jgi:hypothetical protein
MPKKPTHMQVQVGKNPMVEYNLKVELWVINKAYNWGTMEEFAYTDYAKLHKICDDSQ